MSDKEFKFVVCVEWDSLEGFGFYVFLDDDLDWLIKRIAKAQKTGFDTAIGSCPNLVIKEAEETIRGFHFGLMDYPPKGYEEGKPGSMVGS